MAQMSCTTVCLCSSGTGKENRKKKKGWGFPVLFRQPTIVLHRVETFPFAASHFCLSYTELLFLSGGTLLWASCCQKLPVTVQSTQAYRQEIFYLFILLLFYKWHRRFSSPTNISWFPLNIYLEGGKGEPTSSSSRSAYNTPLLTCVY